MPMMMTVMKMNLNKRMFLLLVVALEEEEEAVLASEAEELEQAWVSFKVAKNTDLQGEHTVKKLMRPYEGNGHCVTCDNFFYIPKLGKSLVGLEDLLDRNRTKKQKRIAIDC